MPESCRLIIAFSPIARTTYSIKAAEELLLRHPLRVDRIEDTSKGILAFAHATDCQSINLNAMRESLSEAGERAGFKVRLQREDLFKAMHSLTLS